MTHHRVAQLLDLLTLPPEIQAALDVPPERLPKGVTQKRVKRLARGGDDVGLATTIAAGAALTLGLR